MGLFSVFKRQARTEKTGLYKKGFSNYKNQRFLRRKPFVPKSNSLDSTRTNPRHGKRWILFWFYSKIALGLLFLLAVLYVLFLTKLFQIQNIDIQGEADTAQEQGAIKEELQKYLGENLLFFTTRKEEEHLLLEYPYLKNLQIDRDFFHTLSVTLETYPTIANVRMEFRDGSSENYVINEEGYIASIGTSKEGLPLIVMDVTGTDLSLESENEEEENSGENPEENLESLIHSQNINEELIPKDTLNLLLETAKNFEGKFDMQILEIHYLKRAREIHLYTERLFYVWIDMTQDINNQLEKLKRALIKINIYEAPLEYIDLRISGQNGEKVIYKLSE